MNSMSANVPIRLIQVWCDTVHDDETRDDVLPPTAIVGPGLKNPEASIVDSTDVGFGVGLSFSSVMLGALDGASDVIMLGRNEGTSEGTDDGMSEGIVLGEKDGFQEGDRDGWVDGLADGTRVGDVDGGVSDGLLLGEMDGEEEGNLVGCDDGCTDLDGCNVGGVVGVR